MLHASNGYAVRNRQAVIERVMFLQAEQSLICRLFLCEIQDTRSAPVFGDLEFRQKHSMYAELLAGAEMKNLGVTAGSKALRPLEALLAWRLLLYLL